MSYFLPLKKEKFLPHGFDSARHSMDSAPSLSVRFFNVITPDKSVILLSCTAKPSMRTLSTKYYKISILVS